MFSEDGLPEHLLRLSGNRIKRNCLLLSSSQFGIDYLRQESTQRRATRDAPVQPAAGNLPRPIAVAALRYGHWALLARSAHGPAAYRVRDGSSVRRSPSEPLARPTCWIRDQPLLEQAMRRIPIGPFKRFRTRLSPRSLCQRRPQNGTVRHLYCESHDPLRQHLPARSADKETNLILSAGSLLQIVPPVRRHRQDVPRKSGGEGTGQRARCPWLLTTHPGTKTFLSSVAIHRSHRLHDECAPRPQGTHGIQPRSFLAAFAYSNA